MRFRLDKKTAIVTGGGSGIGKAIALALAAQGAIVHIFEFSVNQAKEVVQEIKSRGGQAIAHACDVSQQAQVLAAVQEVLTTGQFDILINNAGVAHIGTVETTTEADLDRLYAVNIKGVYNCIHACIPHFKTREAGVIINLASIAASVGIAERFAYSMTKGAVLTMTYSVAKDYVRHGIRCNSISPARVHTPFVDGFLAKHYPGQESEMFDQLAATQPIGRMGKPTEVAHLACYLCSDEAAFITGTDFPIDGGFLKLIG